MALPQPLDAVTILRSTAQILNLAKSAKAKAKAPTSENLDDGPNTHAHPLASTYTNKHTRTYEKLFEGDEFAALRMCVKASLGTKEKHESFNIPAVKCQRVIALDLM